MGIYDITVRRPVGIAMVVLGVAVFGVIAYKQLPLTLMPTMNYPRLTIRTEYPGSGPEEVERQVSRPIEEIVGTVSHLLRIVSHSRSELSEIIVEFDWKVQMDLALQEVREKLDLLRFPQDVKSPVLLRYDPHLDPMMRLGLWGRADLYQLRRYAEETMRPALETLPGVAAVKILGGLEREVEVALDEKKLRNLGLRIKEVVQRLKEENINLAGGRLREGATFYWVRTLNEFANLDEMRDLVLVEREGRPIRLRDIARLRFHAKEQEVLTRVNGKWSVVLAVFREADANIVDVSRRVKARLFGTVAQQQYVRHIQTQQKQRETRKEGGTQEGFKGGVAGTKRKGRGDRGKRKGARATGEKGQGDAKKSKRRGGWSKRRKARRKKRLHQRMTRFLLYHLPSGMDVQVLRDQAVFIRRAIDEVLQAAVVGGAVAVFVLFLFLQHAWSTVIIGLSIPISVVATFSGLFLLGVSLNIMSLGGLALGIGMLVDNSIVVLESIMRYREEGDDAARASVLGVAEVGGAVTASTLTTVAVFFPIVFVQGVAGQLLRDLSLAVVLSLLSSLMVSLFLIPMLSALQWSVTWDKPGKSGAEAFALLLDGWRGMSSWSRVIGFFHWASTGWSAGGVRRGWVLLCFLPSFFYVLARFFLHLSLELFKGIWTFVWVVFLWGLRMCGGVGVWALGWCWRPVSWAMETILGFLHWSYSLLLRGALGQVVWVLGVGVFVAFLAFQRLPSLEREFVPKVHQGEYHLELAFPVGTPLQHTAKWLRPIEEHLTSIKGVKLLTSTMGVEKTELQNADKGEHSATLSVKLVPTENIEKQEKEVIALMRRHLRKVPGLRVKVTYPSLISLRTPIEVEIKGEDLLTLGRIAKRAQERLEELPSLRDLRSSVVSGLPEIQILYDRVKLLRYGLSVQDVAQAVRDKVHGAVATRFRQRERRLDVLVRVQKKQIASLQDLLALTVHSANGMIPLRQVAKIKVDEGPSQILRVGSQRAVILRAELGGVALGEVSSNIQETMEQLRVPTGYSAGLSGQSEEMERSLRSLLYALLLSVFLVYLVMASQFESLLSPFVILFSIPLALTGVVGFFWWFAIPVSVMVLIGMIILAGIVVNNAIVLVDAIWQHRERGMEALQAIEHAGKLRLRPILMTTSTTVLGLLPLAVGVGEGSEFRRPLAMTIMVGLLFSTLLTLVFIPVLYRLVFVRQAEGPCSPSSE